jgi:multiple sugar transport system permease protein
MNRARGASERSPSNAPRRRAPTPWLLLGPALLLVVGLRIVPMLLDVAASVTDLNLARPYDPVTFVGLDNYGKLLQTSDFQDAVITTAVISLPALALEMVIGLALALWLTRSFRGRGTARSVMLLPYLLTPVVIGNFFRMFYSAEFGQLNYYLQAIHVVSGNVAWLTDLSTVRPAIIVMEVWHTTPFVTLLCLAGLLSLPREPIEAATVDGASPWQSFRHVILPMLAPVLVATFALRAMDILQLFDEVYVMTGGGPGHLSEVFNLYLYKRGFRTFQMGFTSAAAIVLVIAVGILGLVAVLAQRRQARRATEATDA